MGTPLMDETDLISRLREGREVAETEGGARPSEEDPLAASMKEEAQRLRQQNALTRMRVLNAEARTEETQVEGVRAQAEAVLLEAEAKKVNAEVQARRSEIELAQLETERKVQAMVEQGVPEDAARRALGLVARGQAVPAVNPDGSATTVFSQFLEGVKTMMSLQSAMEEMAARRIQSQQPQQPQQPAARPYSLVDELQHMRALRAELSNMAVELGFVPRDQALALQAPPKEGLESLMVDLKDLTKVPATMAVQIFSAQEEAKARIYEIDKKIEAEREKWQTWQNIANQIFGAFNFREIGKAMAAAGPQAPAPSQAPAGPPAQQSPSQPQQTVYPSKVMKLQCGNCGNPTVFATREMVLEKQKAACATCGAVWDLVPASSEPAPAKPEVIQGQGGPSTNGHGEDGLDKAMAEILGGGR